MGNFDFLVAFFHQNYPTVLPKRIPKIVLGMPEKFHVDLHRNCLQTGQQHGVPTGEGVRSTIVWVNCILSSCLGTLPVPRTRSKLARAGERGKSHGEPEPRPP